MMRQARKGRHLPLRAPNLTNPTNAVCRHHHRCARPDRCSRLYLAAPMRLALLMLAVLALAALAGCETPSALFERTISHVDGSSERTVLKATQPRGATVPAVIEFGGEPVSVAASTGTGQGIDQALASLSSSTGWLAIICAVVGVGSLIAKRFVPVIPSQAPVLLLAAAGVLWSFPVVLDRYGLYLLLAAAGGAAWIGYGYWDNRRKVNETPPGKVVVGNREGK